MKQPCKCGRYWEARFGSSRYGYRPTCAPCGQLASKCTCQPISSEMVPRMSPVQLECRRFDGLVSAVDELIRLDESRTDEKLLQAIAAADAEADARDEGDTRDEESLEDHNIQGLGADRDVFDADGEQ